MEEQDVKINLNLKAMCDRKNSYADKGKIPRYFKVGENMLLKVEPKKIYLKVQSCTKMVVKYCGPFEILDRIGLVAYTCIEC